MAIRAYIQLDMNMIATQTKAPMNESDLKMNNVTVHCTILYTSIGSTYQW